MKLNKTIRENIASGMSQKAFGDKKEQIKKEKAEAAQNLYVACLGGKEKVSERNKLLTKINKLVASPLLDDLKSGYSFVRMASGVTFNLGGRQHYFLFDKPVPSGYRIDVKAGLKEGDLFEKIIDREDDTSKEGSTFYRETMGILNSVTTAKKLIEVWPESAPFIPQNDTPITTEIAPTMKKINKLIK